MKKWCSVAAVLCLLLSLCACGGTTGGHTVGGSQGKTVSDILSDAAQGNEPSVSATAPTDATAPVAEPSPADRTVDVDLTVLGSTMVYSEVYNMMTDPLRYTGQTVKMQGTFLVYEGEERNYYACLIKDATACCAQGLEFLLPEGYTYPDNTPPVGSTITVTGTFDTYHEGTSLYCQLVDAAFVS